MSSDSELGGPSPLPSPIFARCSPARGTVARKCREFYLKRLERTASMQKRWSICDVPQDSFQEFDSPADLKKDNDDLKSNTENETNEISNENSIGIPRDCDNSFGGYPLRKCRSSFDLAMDSLRKEISSLIAQDNDLFRQLLSLHDSIAELRERQRHSALCMDDEDEDEEEDIEISRCVGNRSTESNSPSLESLSDPGELPETSPESTLSSRSSLSGTSSDSCKQHIYKSCGNHHRNRYRKDDKHRYRANNKNPNDSRPLVFIDKSEICFRCRKMAPPYRRSSSITSLYYLHEDMESYDSGIHLQGSHSDSDHEIFV
ncbi:uncharacterized protein [Parasteatoda tepidariorum]|uniref:uncharacterized protein n=1 Tax=Parasteatoda tepidariorum TaxID=114398 RepID=UPI00077FD235|nr:uncharacterized protein LOC107455646 [Parasteatoda tepidariorum]